MINLYSPDKAVLYLFRLTLFKQAREGRAENETDIINNEDVKKLQPGRTNNYWCCRIFAPVIYNHMNTFLIQFVAIDSFRSHGSACVL